MPKTDYRNIEKVPDRCGGSAVVAGTRIRVSVLLTCHRQGMTVEEIVNNYPHLRPRTCMMLWPMPSITQKRWKPTWLPMMNQQHSDPGRGPQLDMNPIRFFTDEDVYGVIAPQLRTAGYDAISTPEASRLGETDLSQFIWATQERRVLVTFNVSHFARLHHQWMQQGKHHAGLIVSQQRPIGETVRRLLHLAQTLSADDMRDRLEYLSNW